MDFILFCGVLSLFVSCTDNGEFIHISIRLNMLHRNISGSPTSPASNNSQPNYQLLPLAELAAQKREKGEPTTEDDQNHTLAAVGNCTHKSDRFLFPLYIHFNMPTLACFFCRIRLMRTASWTPECSHTGRKGL